MSPPSMRYTSKTERSGKDKGFSPNLGAIDSQGPESPNHGTPWDTETDHILSFFLSGEAPPGGSMPDFASMGGNGGSSTSSNSPPMLAPNIRPDLTQTASSNSEVDNDEDDSGVPPPTPVINFYGGQPAFYASTAHRSAPPQGARAPPPGSGHAPMMYEHHQPAAPGTAMTSSSSSSSLSSIAATLVSGGPLMYPPYPSQPHPHAQVPASQHAPQRTASPMDRDSPVSPAALIGNGQENLMLPPPTRPHGGPQSGGVHMQTGPQSNASVTEQQERHLAWLRDLNAVARAASGPSGAPVPISIAPSGAPEYPHGAPYGDPNLAYGHRGVPGPAPAHPHHHPAQLAPNGMMYAPNPGAPQGMMPPPHHHHAGAPKPAVESAEKRAKRLERNRESARRSRKKKKERLTTLEAQVNKLHCEIEEERRLQINAMVPAFKRFREKAPADGFSDVNHVFGCSNEVSRSVLDFQHSTLRSLMYPRYQKMLVWFTLLDESYFAMAKEEYVKGETKASKPASGKISSKQIGDEMTNGVKTEKQGSSKRRVTFEDKGDNKGGERNVRPNLTPRANEATRFWPLFCYELSFSVDQEERFVAAHKRMVEMNGARVAENRSQMAAAVRTGDSLREATFSLSHMVARREASAQRIMTSTQSAAFQGWLSSNRDRFRDIVQQRGTLEDKASLSSDATLDDICRRLNEVLRISKAEK